MKETDSDGHGTHVAGIAAGNGSSSASGYIGVAPDADIIFVKTTFQDADIIDGITYIRQKAAAAGEPFVINLSLGSQDGAHDGTDPMDIDIDTVLAATSGSAIVVAAGNEGSEAIHEIGPSRTAVRLRISSRSPHTRRRASHRTITFRLICGMKRKIS